MEHITKVFIADGSEEFCAALRSALERKEGFQVVGSACDGEAAIRAALSTAFFDWRARQVLARVYAGNTRSIRAVRACGFSCEHRDERLFRYRITMSDYLEHVQA